MGVQTKASNGGSDEGNGGFMATCWLRLRSSVDELRHSILGFAGKLAWIARDDPRRVTHSLKVGLALTLVSVVYFVTPLYNGHTDNTMWAVLTVVLVMEFTVGGTLSKGLNRAFATLLAGILAVSAHLVADLCGEKGEPILIGVFIFFVASAATFSRFIPVIMARYDYGVTIFILTFSLVAVSSYRVEEIIELAHQRFTTILLGVATCLIITIFVFPVWAGEDLNELTASNLDKLAEFLEGTESECFGEITMTENLEGKAFFQAYKSVLSSKTKEESLCSFASWEPGHGKFNFRHPWSQYKEIGILCRQCASAMEALASYVVTITKSLYPEANSELCLKVRRAYGEMNLQSAKALRELSSAIRSMTVPAVTNNDMSKAMEATNYLISELSEDINLLQVIHVAIILSRLSDINFQVKEIIVAVDNLARLAHFKTPTRRQVGVIVDIMN